MWFVCFTILLGMYQLFVSFNCWKVFYCKAIAHLLTHSPADGHVDQFQVGIALMVAFSQCMIAYEVSEDPEWQCLKSTVYCRKIIQLFSNIIKDFKQFLPHSLEPRRSPNVGEKSENLKQLFWVQAPFSWFYRQDLKSLLLKSLGGRCGNKDCPQWGQAKPVHTELAWARESAIITCLAETQKKAAECESLIVSKRGLSF